MKALSYLITRVHPVCSFLLRPFILIFFLFNIHLSNGQCFPSSTNSGSVASIDNSIGSVAFLNPSNALVSDNNRSVATAVASLFTGNSNYLKITGFGFTIPSYASICGVEVQIEKRAGGLALGAWIRDNEVKLVIGNTVTGSNMGYTTADWGTTDAYYTHGSSADLWGTTLTPADVNASDFGVAISAKFNGLAIVFPSSQIDHIQMTVYYNPILPIKIISFQSALQNNKVSLQWETTDEEAGESITLQRSANGTSDWQDLAMFETPVYNTIHQHSYTDYLTQKGNYAYRLKVSNQDKRTSYSEIRNVVFNGSMGKPVLYPNPASDFITVTNLLSINDLAVFDITMRRMKISLKVINEHTVKVNISHFPAGIYMLASNNQRLQFIRE